MPKSEKPKRPRRPPPILTPQQVAEHAARRQALTAERQAQVQRRHRGRTAEEEADMPPEILEFERSVNERLNAMLPEINKVLNPPRKS